MGIRVRGWDGYLVGHGGLKMNGDMWDKGYIKIGGGGWWKYDYKASAMYGKRAHHLKRELLILSQDIF